MKTQVFIIRIWMERREIANQPPVFRGVLEHVPSGKQSYFASLKELVELLIPYMKDLGVSPKAYEDH